MGRIILWNRAEKKIVSDQIRQAGVVKIVQGLVLKAVIPAERQFLGIGPGEFRFQNVMRKALIGKTHPDFQRRKGRRYRTAACVRRHLSSTQRH